MVDHRVGVDEVILRADLGVARRNNQVGAVERVHHVHRRQPARLQRVAVEVDHDLPVLAAKRRRHRGALDRGEKVADVVLRLVANWAWLKPLPETVTSTTGSDEAPEGEHQRWQRAGRQMAQVRHRQVTQPGRRRVKVYSGMEEHLDDADAGQRARLDMLDFAAHGEEALEAGGDVAFHVLRRHAGIKRGDDYRRNMERWKNVDRHPGERVESKDGDNQRSHDYRVGIAQRERRHRTNLNRPWRPRIAFARAAVYFMRGGA